MVFKKFSSTLTWSSTSWLMLTWFAFWSSVNTRGTNFVATRCMLSFSVRIAWHDPKLMPTYSAISLIVKRRFWRIKWRTALMWMLSVDVEGHPLRESSSIDVLPVLKQQYHSKHCVLLIHSPLKACWSIFHISVAVFPSLKQNFTHTHTHVVLPSPSFSLPKKITSRSLQLFTSVAVSRLLVVIEWCGKKSCVTNGCHHSAPLAAVRSVHWFRRCALSPVFYYTLYATELTHLRSSLLHAMS